MPSLLRASETDTAWRDEAGAGSRCLREAMVNEERGDGLSAEAQVVTMAATTQYLQRTALT